MENRGDQELSTRRVRGADQVDAWQQPLPLVVVETMGDSSLCETCGTGLCPV
jgi:hypothetical protein